MFGNGPKRVSSPEEGSFSEDRRNSAPRATIRGRIIVHNSGQIVIGTGVNISASGIFVETTDPIFRLGETLKLTCRVEGVLRPFHVQAVVVRLNNDRRFPLGYGMRFEGLAEPIRENIQRLIDDLNKVIVAS